MLRLHRSPVRAGLLAVVASLAAFLIVSTLLSNDGKVVASSVNYNSQTDDVAVWSSFHDIFPSQSAKDWVSISDYILDVTMTNEREGSGDRHFTGRVGEFQVNAVLSARRDAPELSDTFQMDVLGWSHPEGSDSDQTGVATLGSPRLEVGHRYIVGIIRYEPRCSPEDGVDPGGWGLIGSNGAIPYDEGRLGWGEVEGRPGEWIDTGLDTLQSEIVVDRSTVGQLEAALNDAPKAERPVQPGVRIGC